MNIHVCGCVCSGEVRSLQVIQTVKSGNLQQFCFMYSFPIFIVYTDTMYFPKSKNKKTGAIRT